MLTNIKRAVAGVDCVFDPLEFYDDEASPVSLTSYSGRLRIEDPDGAMTVNSTTAPRVVVATSRTISYRALGTDIAASGVYKYSLEYTDANGVVHVGDRGLLYVDHAPGA